MNTTFADRGEFKPLLSFHNPDSFLFEDQEAVLHEPFEEIHKIRRLNPSSSDSHNPRSPINFPQKTELTAYPEEKPLLKPQKVVVKSLSSNPTSPENFAGRFFPMMTRDNNEKKQPFSIEEHQARLERMRSFGSHQAKELENYIASRKSSSLSTMNDSPCSSLRGSFHCVLSPKNEEDIKTSLLEAVNNRYNAEPTSAKAAQSLNHFDDLASSSETMEQQNLMMPVSQESEAHSNLRRAVSLPQQGSIGDLEENKSSNSPTLSYQNYHGYRNDYNNGNKGMSPLISQMAGHTLGETNRKQPGKDFRSLVDSQMKAIESLVLTKKSNSQIDYSQNSTSSNNKNATQEQSPTLEAKRSMTDSPVQRHNPMDMAMLQRMQFQRMMQYQFALQQRSYLLKQQKALFQSNTEQKGTGNNEFMHKTTMETSPMGVQPKDVVSNPCEKDMNISDNIDKFFTSSDHNGRDQAPSSLENTDNCKTSQSFQSFFETDHFLNSFTEHSSTIKPDNIAPQSLKNIFLSEKLF